MRFGIDISRYQHNSPIDYVKATDFLKWVSGGLQPFVFSNSASPYYAQDEAGFRAAGSAWGSYFFADPTADPIHAEQTFRAAVGSVPAALDLEVEHPAGWAATGIWGQEWLDQPLERSSLLYSNLNFLENMPGAPWAHPIWFAGTVDPDTNPATFGRTWIWQYGQSTIPGISGPVDMNKWLGTDTQFYAFFQIPVPQPPKPKPGIWERFRNWLPWHRG